jgi:energy-converting hydrogenase Eha subunit A
MDVLYTHRYWESLPTSVYLMLFICVMPLFTVGGEVCKVKCKLIRRELFVYRHLMPVLQLYPFNNSQKSLVLLLHTERYAFILRTLSGVWYFGLCREKNSRRSFILCCIFATTVIARGFKAGRDDIIGTNQQVFKTQPKVYRRFRSEIQLTASSENVYSLTVLAQSNDWTHNALLPLDAT